MAEVVASARAGWNAVPVTRVHSAARYGQGTVECQSPRGSPAKGPRSPLPAGSRRETAGRLEFNGLARRIWTASPVFRLRPNPRFRSFTRNTPKPRNSPFPLGEGIFDGHEHLIHVSWAFTRETWATRATSSTMSA